MSYQSGTSHFIVDLTPFDLPGHTMAVLPSKPASFLLPLPISNLALHFHPSAKPQAFSLCNSQTLLPFRRNPLSTTPPAKPEILAGPHDSVSFTVAESDGDFNHLSSLHNQRDEKELQALAPQLGPLLLLLHSSSDSAEYHHAYAPRDALDDTLPLLAVRVTVFPNSGFCLGLAFHHVVADARTFNNFMKLWSSFCTSSTRIHDHSSYFPSYDRTAIVDARGLESVFIKEWWKRSNTLLSVKGHTSSTFNSNNNDKVRTTFVMGLADMERIKSWVVIRSNEQGQSHSLDLSPYVLTCSYLWVCVLKTQQQAIVLGGLLSDKSCAFEDPNYFGFVAGGLTRVDYPVAATYLGNCVGFGRATARRGELLGEYGVLVAAKAIRSMVKRLDRAMFGGAEKWISEWGELIGSDIHVMVCGSPKVDLYERDFGWGRPKKIEDVEIDSTKAISLSESRDIKGGMEIGLVLPKHEMDAFTILFKEGFKSQGSLMI